MSVYFTIITLGPNINVSETWTITSPIYYGTAGVIPYFSTMEVPWEYSWMALLTGTILCAILLQEVTRYAWLASVGILLQQNICFTQSVGSTTPIHMDPQILSTLQTKSDDSVFNFPLNNHRDVHTQSPHHEYLWMQTIHERPIAYGIQQSWLHRSELWRRLDEVSRKGFFLEKHSPTMQTQHLSEFRKDSLTNSTKRAFNTLYCTSILFLSPSTTHKLLLWTDIFGAPLITK